MAANTSWKYASVEVGKWNGTAVLAADTARLCSPCGLRMGPGLPQKLSMKCVQPPTPDSWVCTPFLTPPPMELAPNPSLYS